MTELSLLAIAIGGGLGSVARFVVSREMGNWLGSYLPYGTLTVNVAGSLALGWFAAVFIDSSGNKQCPQAWIDCGLPGGIHDFFHFQLRISTAAAEWCSLASFF